MYDVVCETELEVWLVTFAVAAPANTSTAQLDTHSVRGRVGSRNRSQGVWGRRTEGQLPLTAREGQWRRRCEVPVVLLRDIRKHPRIARAISRHPEPEAWPTGTEGEDAVGEEQQLWPHRPGCARRRLRPTQPPVATRSQAAAFGDACSEPCITLTRPSCRPARAGSRTSVGTSAGSARPVAAPASVHTAPPPSYSQRRSVRSARATN